MVHPAVIVGLLLLAFQGYRMFRMKRAPEIVETELVGSMQEQGPSFFDFLTGNMGGVDRYPTEVHELSSDEHFGRHPEFFNQADFSKGRFIRWEPPTHADKADDAKRNLRRMRLSQDTTVFWFFKSSKEMVTPCVFDPELDVEFIPPGTKAGVPLCVKILILKRPISGSSWMKSISSSSRYCLRRLSVASNIVTILSISSRVTS